ncbi:flavodoxin family protein [Maledivibacter halophilus]|uniref:Multimeric flavodoxin WrbA n=1 Tax=Maledivibacter halophilus TaxID=36842 RepID=A0A1T5LTG5_9FIRM|nr:flavodoxin family protein [Maledivibacter halophilus]SKC79262.1 Multimeric flavodoxin WrbA [Maledivibacter halophilus]
MKFCILMGSPRLNGNTAELVKPFIEELEMNGVEVIYITLADKNISFCRGCYTCQNVTGEYGCPQDDDMKDIVRSIVQSDCLVLAAPIYTWYCPAEMKAVLDRFYGMNKFYGSGKGSLWEGKKCAIIATHGYDVEYGAKPFETGIRRLCEHSNLNYAGMYSVKDEDDKASFQTLEAIRGARKFALKILGKEL